MTDGDKGEYGDRGQGSGRGEQGAGRERDDNLTAEGRAPMNRKRKQKKVHGITGAKDAIGEKRGVEEKRGRPKDQTQTSSQTKVY